MLVMALAFGFMMAGCDSGGGGGGASISADSIAGSTWAYVETLNEPAFDITGVQIKIVVKFTDPSQGNMKSDVINWGNLPPGQFREMLLDESFTVDTAAKTLTAQRIAMGPTWCSTWNNRFRDSAHPLCGCAEVCGKKPSDTAKAGGAAGAGKPFNAL